MEPRHRTAGSLAAGWALVGAVVSVIAFGDVNNDARLLVGAASSVGISTALLAAWLLLRGGPVRDRGGRGGVAGLLLVASAVAMPTFFAWPLNVAAMVLGVVVAVRSRKARADGERGGMARPQGIDT